METRQEATGFYMNVSEAAKEIGVVPATIRNWEKAGLIRIRRRANGYRYFDAADIEQLRQIKKKLSKANQGVSGVRMLTTVEQNMGPAESIAIRQEKPPATPVHIPGSSWKEYRLQRNYSLDDVAGLIGISSSYLSKIENEQANISFETLQKLANFYGKSVLSYFDTPQNDSPVVRKGKGEALEIGLEGLEMQTLIERNNHTLTAYLCTVAPGCEHAVDSAHNGEEFVYVLSGKVEFTLNKQEAYMLSTGDSINFSSTCPHRWRNLSNRQTILLWICTPLEKI